MGKSAISVITLIGVISSANGQLKNNKEKVNE